MYMYVKKQYSPLSHYLFLISPFCLNWSKLVNVVMPIFILKNSINLQFYSFFSGIAYIIQKIHEQY